MRRVELGLELLIPARLLDPAGKLVGGLRRPTRAVEQGPKAPVRRGPLAGTFEEGQSLFEPDRRDLVTGESLGLRELDENLATVF
jgi:hypothetical protein